MYQQSKMTPGGAPIPDNYSGNAFRYPPIGSLGSAPIDEETPLSVGELGREEEKAPLLPVEPLRQTERGHDAGGFGGGVLRLLGSEEWRLLGLCLLLMGEDGSRLGGTGQKNDLLPYLLLLLLCG
jgi:hypothetical protein